MLLISFHFIIAGLFVAILILVFGMSFEYINGPNSIMMQKNKISKRVKLAGPRLDRKKFCVKFFTPNVLIEKDLSRKNDNPNKKMDGIKRK